MGSFLSLWSWAEGRWALCPPWWVPARVLHRYTWLCGPYCCVWAWFVCVSLSRQEFQQRRYRGLTFGPHTLIKKLTEWVNIECNRIFSIWKQNFPRPVVLAFRGTSGRDFSWVSSWEWVKNKPRFQVLWNIPLGMPNTGEFFICLVRQLDCPCSLPSQNRKKTNNNESALVIIPVNVPVWSCSGILGIYGWVGGITGQPGTRVNM